jgi:hypothetical protein
VDYRLNNPLRRSVSPERNGSFARLVGATIKTELQGETLMGRAILLWLLGVPIPIIIIIALLYH